MGFNSGFKGLKMVGTVCPTVQLSYSVPGKNFTFCEVTWRP